MTRKNTACSYPRSGLIWVTLAVVVMVVIASAIVVAVAEQLLH